MIQPGKDARRITQGACWGLFMLTASAPRAAYSQDALMALALGAGGHRLHRLYTASVTLETSPGHFVEDRFFVLASLL